MTLAAPLVEAKPAQAEPFRVMLADDSAVVRGLLTRMLESDPEIVIIASVGDGQMAVRTVERLDNAVEVVVLDLEMPRMDGLTAFGLFAVVAMLVTYALEDRSPWAILGFAASCALGSIYGFLQGTWPFGLVEAIWTLVALHRWHRKTRA